MIGTNKKAQLINIKQVNNFIASAVKKLLVMTETFFDLFFLKIHEPKHICEHITENPPSSKLYTSFIVPTTLTTNDPKITDASWYVGKNIAGCNLCSDYRII